MKVAAVQLRLVQNDRQENLARAAQWVARLAQQGAELVVLPQTLPTGLPSVEPARLAEPLDGPSVETQRALAHDHGIYLVWGQLLAEVTHTYDAALAADPQGKIIALYRRRHLFWREEGIEPGEELTVVNISGLRLGLMLGEDLLYPAMPARLVALGAEAIACLLCSADAQLNRLALSNFVTCLAYAHAYANVTDVMVASACGAVMCDDMAERTGLHLTGRTTLAALSEGSLQTLERDGEGALLANLDGAKVHYFRRLTCRGELVAGVGYAPP